MIEKASNLQDRHQEKSEETNVMWESREIKKQNYSWIMEVLLKRHDVIKRNKQKMVMNSSELKL